METFSDYDVIDTNTISHNCHWNGYGPDHQSGGLHAYTLQSTPDSYHYFGCDWSPEGYVFYVDGRESWRTDGPVSHTEQFILVSTECRGYRQNDGPSEELKTAKLPDHFVVDHVRVFDEIK